MTITAVRPAPRRWLEGAPDYVIDVYAHPAFFARYSVILSSEDMRWCDYRDDWLIPSLALSIDPEDPRGVNQWCWDTLRDLRVWRWANRRRRIRWADLPENVRAAVVRRVEGDVT